MKERLPQSMQAAEYQCIREMVASLRPKRTLEVGMANGESSQIMCENAKALGNVRHVSIDPFQNDPKDLAGFGLKRIREAGLSEQLEFYEDFDYLVLPKLVSEKRTFDFILIDGYHSFDYTLIDLFYADLLLDIGGVVMLHDTAWPSVNKACRFLETHKPYERVSPPLYIETEGLIPKLSHRLKVAAGGVERLKQEEERRTKWLSLSAYKKLENKIVPNTFFKDF